MTSASTTATPLTSLLVDVGAEVEAQLSSRLAVFGVSLADVQVLRLVAAAPGMSQRETALALGTVPTHLGSRVAALCRRGLMERRVFRDGRRRYGLFITSAGIRRLEDVSRVCNEHQAELLDGLSEYERQTLGGLLERLVRGRAAR